MSQQRNRVSREGKAAGEGLARLTEPVIRKMVESGIPDARCASCAFRVGTVPNGCIQTQADALKCVLEGIRFDCHAPNDGRVCHGWYAATIALGGIKAKCPWELSPPDDAPPKPGAYAER